ncbi:hypothetical protein BGW41_006788 [Actinomortierella wolfii]|nr:hypothetical protein BGW41_006788 [Actinomortierella wolfii]
MNIFDLFSTLVVSLPIEDRKIYFKKYPNSFTAEEAIANLGGLQFIQANRDPDPNDPTRIITHVVTTQFSLSKDMARNLCQTFMDARLLESAADPTRRDFRDRGVYRVTGKGAHILEKFVHRNSLPIKDTQHITQNAVSSLFYLEREDEDDTIVYNQTTIDNVFKRFAGTKPNVMMRERSESSGDTPQSPNNNAGSSRDRTFSGTDRSLGIEVKDQQPHNYDVYRHTFLGKAAVDWILDFTTVISKEEAICICQHMVQRGYIEQIGENGRGDGLFKTGSSAIYHLTETGRALAGWESLADRAAGNNRVERGNADVKPLSQQFIHSSNTAPRFPISVARAKRRSADEASLGGSQYNGESGSGTGSLRRLSQLLNDPEYQQILGDAGAMSNYAPSSSGKESVGKPSKDRLGGGNISSNSSQSMTSNATRLSIILGTTVLRDLFRAFLKHHFCEENLSFYLEVLDYKNKFNHLINKTMSYAHASAAAAQSGGDPGSPPPGGNSSGASLAQQAAAIRELEKQICTQAFTIYETYLVAGAQREVNLSHQMRQDITAYMQAVLRNMETPDRIAPATATPAPTSMSSPSSPSAGLGGAGSPKGGAALDLMEPSNDGMRPTTGKELIHISLFDTIHDHVFRLMSTDSVPKFIKTEKYREVMMSRVKHGKSPLSSGGGGGSSSPGGSSGSGNGSSGSNSSAGHGVGAGGGSDGLADDHHHLHHHHHVALGSSSPPPGGAAVSLASPSAVSGLRSGAARNEGEIRDADWQSS